ncbi:MAG: desulfoferrodoxin [Desulfovibrio sp.]|nr:desulfoferrodoxin [Desulfovibrio sp.]
MPKKREVYKCLVCGTIMEILHDGTAVPTCCGQPMQQLVEGSVDAAKEKHVPVLEKQDGGYKVSVGSAAHPMMDAHYIQWIELITEKGLQRIELAPGDAPEAFFPCTEEKVCARAYCNLHGLWKAEN